LFDQWNKLFDEVDVIVTPTTAIAAPLIEGRIVDTRTVSQLMRFITAGNFLGYPGLSVPVGYMNETNLPIGLQLMGKHWQEHVLLRLGNAVEAALQQKEVIPRRPAVFFDILGTATRK
jgi:Asp-tRNA(Asn)/Glu-tRNA(Gln) amidotransferase A subunit family amidase